MAKLTAGELKNILLERIYKRNRERRKDAEPHSFWGSYPTSTKTGSRVNKIQQQVTIDEHKLYY